MSEDWKSKQELFTNIYSPSTIWKYFTFHRHNTELFVDTALCLLAQLTVTLQSYLTESTGRIYSQIEPIVNFRLKNVAKTSDTTMYFFQYYSVLLKTHNAFTKKIIYGNHIPLR